MLLPECSAQVNFPEIPHFSDLRVAPPHPPCCSSGFRTVSFTLRTKDVLSTVTNVLKSCSLPVEHMSSLKPSREEAGSGAGAAPFYRPIRWDKSYYSFTGFRDPEEDLQQARRMEPTLRCFLEASGRGQQLDTVSFLIIADRFIFRARNVEAEMEPGRRAERLFSL